ncbi:MAG TPA: YncE family protein, partial [Candidatus Nitrosocosmicus sp.]|nr:YncE family protein [Candidatus Nitrosocosmicus sp.]
VISTVNDTVIKNITVGTAPEFIERNLIDKIYVTNVVSGTVSVISTVNDTKIDDIPVGTNPFFILYGDTDKLYVANYGSGTVSVISTVNDTVIKNITVGKGPFKMYYDTLRNAIYNLNHDSNSISLIDGTSDTVVGRVSFDIHPPRSGNIECSDVVTPLEKSFYLDSGSNCKAIPNKGYEFLSWEENIDLNATQIINTSKPATAIETFLDLLNLKSEEAEATLKVSTFGSFTANFKELPPPLPPEYLATLFGFVITTGLGVWLIPSLVRWIRAKSDIKKSNYYHQRMKSLYNDGKLDENDLANLDNLRIDLTDSYSKGKVNEKHYERLNSEISIMYEKIFRKRIVNLKDSNDNINVKEQLNKLKEEIEVSHSEQKITETQFNLLNKKISDLEDRDASSEVST